MILLKFINNEREYMLRALKYIVSDLQRNIKADPEEYTEYGAEEPSIDIRLCIDLYNDPDNHGSPCWIFRTGSSDYDPYHSEYCGGSSIGLEDTPESVLNNLIDQLEE